MAYVFAQFILLAVIAWPIETLSFSLIGFLLMLASVVIALSAFTVNRPGNFNVRPDPKKSGKLIVDGPYRFIRHPMYTSLFFAGLSVLFFQFSVWKLVGWLFLIVALALKARFEEKALCLYHQGYVDYQKTNKAFIPWIW